MSLLHLCLKEETWRLVVRGEYEGLSARVVSEDWKPCFGPAAWNESVAKWGARPAVKCKERFQRPTRR